MRLLLLERYQQAQDAGEVAGEGRPKTVSAGNSLPDTADLGLSRKKLSETRKVARAGGMSFATRNDLLGLMWARIVKAVHEKLSDGAGANGGLDEQALKNKLIVAKFFVERMLPETALHLKRIEAGSASVMEMAMEGF